jgi:hypothetical protein
MRFLGFLDEMAAVPADYYHKTFYHGTCIEASAKSILNSGIEPQKVTTNRGKLTPIRDMVYLTWDLSYAIIYTIGGDIAGTKSLDIIDSFIKQEGRYGYLFVIEGSQLNDIQPDEDSIGEMIYDQRIYWLNLFAQKNLTPRRYKKVMDGEYGDWAMAGKELIKLMNDTQKIDLIRNGAHIANKGRIIPTECWKFDKTLTPQLNPGQDNNFFALAERIR